MRMLPSLNMNSFMIHIHLIHIASRQLYTLILILLSMKMKFPVWNFPLVVSHKCSKLSESEAFWTFRQGKVHLWSQMHYLLLLNNNN